MDLLRRFYGAHPLHLVVLLGALALTAYTISVLGIDNLFNPGVWWQSIAVWFAVAVIAHDLILFPLYAVADRILTLRRPRRATVEESTNRPPLTNYVRMPTLASGLLLLMFLPGIIEQGAASYYTATGLTQEPYLFRWIAITTVLYVVAAIWYVTKLLLAKRDSTVNSD